MVTSKHALSYLLFAGIVLSSILGIVASAPPAFALTVATETDEDDYTSIGSYSLEDRGGGVFRSDNTVYIAETGGTNIHLTAYDITTQAITKSGVVEVIDINAERNPSTAVASTTKNDIVFLQSQGGTTQVLNNAGTTFFAESLATANAELVGTTVNEIHLWLKKTGAPASSTMTIAVFDSTCTSVYTFGTVDVSTLTTSFVETTFTGAPPGRTLANGDRIGAFYTGGSAGNSGDLEYVNSDQYDGTTNTITHTATGAAGSCTPTAQTARELHMQLSYKYVATSVDDDSDSTFWENPGYVVRAIQTDSTITQALRTAGASATPTTIGAFEKKTTSSLIAGVSVDQINLRLSKTGSPTGTLSVVEVSATGSISNKVNQASGTTSDCLFSSSTPHNGCVEHLNSGAALIGQTVNSMTIALKRVNSPTGTGYACVLDSSNTCVYTFGTVDLSTLGTSYAAYTFTNYASSRVLALGDRIGMKGDTQGGTGQALIPITTTQTYDSTNAEAAQFTLGSWSADLTRDLGSSTANQAWKLDLVTAPTILNTFNTMSASSLTTTETIYTFTSTGSDFTLSSGATTYIGVLYTAQDIAGATVNVAVTAADAYDGTTNSILSAFTNGAFSDTTTADLRFRLIDTAQIAADQEASSNIYIDNGSNVATAGVEVSFPDASKIPQIITVDTSTDAATWTTRATWTPTQSATVQQVHFDSADLPLSVRYVRLQVSTWGSNDFSFAVAELSSLNSASVTSGGQGELLSKFNSDGTIFAFGCYSACANGGGSITTVVSKINVTAWAANSPSYTIASRTVSMVGDSSGTDGPNAFGAATEDFVYILEVDCDCAQDDYWLHRLPYDLSTSEILATWTEATDAGFADAGETKMLAFNTGGADTIVISYVTQSTDHIFWKVIGGTATKIQLKIAEDLTDGAGQIAYATRDGTVYFRYLPNTASAGDWTTAKVDTFIDTHDETDTLNYNSFPRTEGFSVRTSTTLTFSSDPEDLYLATRTQAHGLNAFESRGEQVPFYIQAKDTALGTLSTGDVRYYYLGDGNFIESSATSGTSWTFTRYAGTTANINIFVETLNVPLPAESVLDDLTWDENDIFLACDGLYKVPTNQLIAADFSDCEQYIIKDTEASTIGRELTFTANRDIVWTSDYTLYNIHVTLTQGKATDFYVNVVYDSKSVDINYFDGANNVQMRLLYGQCYTLEYKEILSGDTVESSTLCADDVVFKEDVIATELGFTFWNAPWGASHSYNTTSFILTTIVRHNAVPYNYTVNVINSTKDVVVDQDFNGIATEVDSQQFNLTAFATETPLKVIIYNQDGHIIYNQYIDYGGNWLSALGDAFGTSGGSFAGWGLLMFLPIIFAAIFTRNTAGIGGGMLVAVIGVLTVMGLLALPLGAVWLITFVAIIGILAYRILYQ